MSNKHVQKVFLIGQPKSDFMSVYGGEELSNYMLGEGYFRATEVVEVEFTLRPQEETVPERIKAIDEKIAEERKTLNKKLMDLEQQKAELLAISFEPLFNPEPVEPSIEPEPQSVFCKTFYATIASDQFYNGEPGPGCVRINAHRESEARELIRNATNNKWSMMYTSYDDVHDLDKIVMGELGYLIPKGN